MLHFVFAQPLVGAIHIADDDGNVLEPSVIATGIGRRRSASWCEELGQLDVLFAESHPRNPHPQTKHTREVLVTLAVYFRFRHLLKIEYVRVEVDRTIEIRDSQANRVNSLHQWVCSSEPNAGCQQYCAKWATQNHDSLR